MQKMIFFIIKQEDSHLPYQKIMNVQQVNSSVLNSYCKNCNFSIVTITVNINQVLSGATDDVNISSNFFTSMLNFPQDALLKSSKSKENVKKGKKSFNVTGFEFDCQKMYECSTGKFWSFEFILQKLELQNSKIPIAVNIIWMTNILRD